MTVELVLAAVVGLVAGVLAALWWDSQTLVRQVQAANSEKQKSLATLQKFQIQHSANEQELRMAQKELVTAFDERTQLEETIARQLAEINAGREQLQTTIKTNETLKENLQELQDRLEEVEGLQLTAEEKLEAALAENNQLVGDVQLMEAEIFTFEAKVEQLTRELQQIQEQVADLEQRALAAESQLAAVEAERDNAQVQLQQAELVNAEQKAGITALQQKLQEAEATQQQLAVVEEKLQTADAHIQKLQDTVEDVQVKMNYSGKSELQLIRGIGPTYARRLSEFGIQSFADLADCNPEQVASIIKKKNWQAVDIQVWLDEAKALAATFSANND
jgi:predicted flap endonuclease-1-like 5' DNA nuclease/regulator of replication initiation timing